MDKNKIIGYHGTTQDAAQKILDEGCFKYSNKDNEWLGEGAYFFAYRGHAEWWVSHSRYEGKETRIMRAALEYTDEQLLDMDDPDQLKQIDAVVKVAIEILNKSAVETAKVDLSKLSRKQRWNFICNLYRSLNTDIGITIYTFPTSVLYDCIKYKENQRQICVSKQSIITDIQIDEVLKDEW